MFDKNFYSEKQSETLIPNVIVQINSENEILVGTGKTMNTATSDTLRKKMGIELTLKDEDPG